MDKHHGIPGMGYISHKGEKGESGNGVHFGFLNDFFDCTTLNIESLLYVARRRLDKTGGTTGEFAVGFNYDYFTGVRDNRNKDVDPVDWNKPSTTTQVTRFSSISDAASVYTAENHPNLDYAVPTTKIIVDMNNIPKNDSMGMFNDVYIVRSGIYRSWLANNNSNTVARETVRINEVLNDGATLDTVWIRPGYKKAASDTEKVVDNLTTDYNGFTVEAIDKNARDLTVNESNYLKVQQMNIADIKELIQEKESVIRTYEGSTNSTRYNYLNQAYNGTAPDGYLNYAHWRTPGTSEINIPQTLRADIKPGDILYVYIDQALFDVDSNITGMIYVTPDMVGATYDYVLQHITTVNPFKFTDFETVNNRIYIHTGLNIGSYNVDNISDEYKIKFAKNYNKLLSANNNAQLIVNTYTKPNTNTNFIELKGVQDDTDYSMCISKEVPANDDTTGLYTTNILHNDSDIEEEIVDDKMVIRCKNSNGDMVGLKLPDIRVNNKCITKNIELEGTLKNDRYILDADGYTHTFTEDDFDIKTITFKVVDEQFYNVLTVDKSDVTIGAYIIDTTVSTANNVIKVLATENSIKLPIIMSGHYSFVIIPFVDIIGDIRHYGRQTSVIFNVINGSVSLDKEYYISSTNVPDDNVYDKNEDIIFSIVGLSSEESNNITMSIDWDDAEIEIQSVYCMDKVIYNKHNVRSDYETATNGVWLEIPKDIKSVNENTIKIKMTAKNNLPNSVDSDDRPTTVEDLLKLYKDCTLCSVCSDYFIYLLDDSLAKTKNRSELVTVKYTKNKEEKYAYYKITQPGFIDPRTLPVIELEALTDPVMLESCNADNLGVLANQFQYFIDVTVKDFDDTNWGLYQNDYKMELNIVSNHENYELIDKWQKSSAVNLSTIGMVNNDPDNWFKITADVIDPEFDPTTTPVTDYNNIPNATVSYKYEYSNLSGDFTITNNSTFESNIGTETVTAVSKCVANGENLFTNGAMYHTYDGVKKDFTIKIHDIPLGLSKFRIRVLVELGTPVPSVLNFNWHVSDIKITDINDASVVFRASDVVYNTNTVYPGVLFDIKSIGDGVNTVKPKYTTGNKRFIINPMSMIVAPDTLDSNLIFNPYGVKMSGSEEPLRGVLSMYGNDLLSRYASDVVFEDSTNVRNNDIFDWRAWLLDISRLQDNIRTMKVINKNPFTDKYPDDSFKGLCHKITSSIIPPGCVGFNRPSSTTPYKPNAFVKVEYRSTLMNAKYRDDKNTFYYNDNLIDADKYSQTETNTPVFSTFPVDFELRTPEMIKSMEVWNFEWEKCDYFKDINNIHGAISRYGNGYKHLKDTHDTGQYHSDEALPLATVKAVNSDTLYNKIMTCLINDFNGVSTAPDDDMVYRTVLYNVGFEVPLYGTPGGTRSYHITSPLMSMYDYDYFDHVDNCSYQPYKDEKNKNGYTNLIPYTHCYNIYPRFAFNEDYDTIHVFMLRRPSIGVDGCYSFKDYSKWKQDNPLSEVCTEPYNL